MQSEKTRLFIYKSTNIHGDRYDYSKVSYRHSKINVTITCSVHGDFEQMPSNHLKGLGCKTCGVERRSKAKIKESRDSFIVRATNLHGGKYDYTKSIYTGYSGKIIITCKVHGDFEQAPTNHLRGQGCYDCAINTSIDKKVRRSRDTFIDRAKDRHGNKYDYSKTVYLNSGSKVVITCEKHGDFEQTASVHLNGSGCPACGGVQRLTEELFITKSRSIHGDRYDYSKTKYTGSHNNILVACLEHGDFEQRATNHLQGIGCPSCSWDRNVQSDVYLLTNGFQVKIGISKHTDLRLSQLNNSQPFKAELITAWQLPTWYDALAVESKAHRILGAHRHVYDHAFDGSTEWFNISKGRAKQLLNRLVENQATSKQQNLF